MKQTPRPLTQFDRLGLKDGGLIVAVRQMDGLNSALRHRQAKEEELRKMAQEKQHGR